MISIWLCIAAVLYHQQYISKYGYPFSTPLQNTFINEEKLS